MVNSPPAPSNTATTPALDFCPCGHHSPQAQLVTVPCNVRAFRHESFEVWRCPHCGTINSATTVDLDHYYSRYPFANATLSLPLRLCYGNLYRYLPKLKPDGRLLDYGCANGLFVQYLRELGFPHSYGYDPYGDPQGMGNSKVLEHPFEVILLQDVIEHVEDPSALLQTLDRLLVPGGYILIGTPNASRIDLDRATELEYYNSLHAPYHRHIYTPERLQAMAGAQGWQRDRFFERPFHDTLWFGLNGRAWNYYQSQVDGTLDSIFEPIQVQKALGSARFWFYALFGYGLSRKTDMAMGFHKPD